MLHCYAFTFPCFLRRVKFFDLAVEFGTYRYMQLFFCFSQTHCHSHAWPASVGKISKRTSSDRLPCR